jgi:hypothetical protein
MAQALDDLAAIRVSVWRDDLSCPRIVTGSMACVVDGEIVGITTNPTIFTTAIGAGSGNEDLLRDLPLRGPAIGRNFGERLPAVLSADAAPAGTERSLPMRLSHSVKRNLSVAAALACLGLLSVTARQTSRSRHSRSAGNPPRTATVWPRCATSSAASRGTHLRRAAPPMGARPARRVRCPATLPSGR